MVIRAMQTEDLPAVARVHKDSYRDDHTTAHFPVRLLTELYACYLQAGAWCYVADDAGRIVGFLIGGSPNVGSAVKDRFTRSQWAAIAGAVVRSPRLWPMIALSRLRGVRRQWRRRRRPSIAASSSTPATASYAVLASIAVRSDCQRSGVARALARAFEQDVVAHGYPKYRTFVRKSNTPSCAFFVSLGATVRFTTDDTLCFAVVPASVERRSPDESMGVA